MDEQKDSGTNEQIKRHLFKWTNRKTVEQMNLNGHIQKDG